MPLFSTSITHVDLAAGWGCEQADKYGTKKWGTSKGFQQ